MPRQNNQKLLKTLDPKRTLIVIWIGPNNYLRNGGEFEDNHGHTNKEALVKGVERSLREIKKEVEGLMKQGFTSFAIGTMPELGGINRNP
ncbi:MAG: hypothetical protein EOP42_28735, partial [Sphingobacteriaceae bacterium]